MTAGNIDNVFPNCLELSRFRQTFDLVIDTKG